MTATRDAPPAAPAVRRTPSRRTRIPLPLLLPAALGLLFLVLPLGGLLVRTPWSTLPQRLTEPGALTALRLSLQTATLATGLCLLLGVPLAWLLARVEFPGRRIVRALVTVPLVLPPVVGGVALLLVFGRRGCSAAGSTRRSGSPCRSPPPGWCSRRRSWRCRSS